MSRSINMFTACLAIGIVVIIILIVYYYRKKHSGLTLYDKLGGIYGIANVINLFSDRIIENPIVGKESKNPFLREWSNTKLDRLPGLKFMRTLWLASLAGGPFNYQGTVPGKCPFSLENAHKKFNITSEEFDEVAKILVQTMNEAGVGKKEIDEVASVFMQHKNEVVLHMANC